MKLEQSPDTNMHARKHSKWTSFSTKNLHALKFLVEKLVHLLCFLEVLFSSVVLVVEYPHTLAGVNSEVWVTLVGKGSSANTALESSLIFLLIAV